MIQRRINVMDADINRLVYELYGLTEEGIAIVKGSLLKEGCSGIVRLFSCWVYIVLVIRLTTHLYTGCQGLTSGLSTTGHLFQIHIRLKGYFNIQRMQSFIKENIKTLSI